MSDDIPTCCPHPDCFPENGDYRHFELKPFFRHAPKDTTGSEDALVSSRTFGSGGEESEDQTNRAFAQLQKEWEASRRRQGGKLRWKSSAIGATRKRAK